MKKLKQTYDRGFTLLEILVASSVMAFLMVIMLSITANVVKSWNRSNGQLEANFEARVALDALTKDLQNIVMRNDGQQWLKLKQDSISSNGMVVDDASWLVFFTTSAEYYNEGLNYDNQAVGAPVAVSYRLAYKDPFPGGGTALWGLYRQVASPDTTFNNIIGQSDLMSNYWDSAPGVPSGTDDESFLAAHIVDFSISFYFQYDNGSGSVQEAYQGPTDEFIVDGEFNAENPSKGWPLYADVRLTVLSKEGAKVVKALTKNYNVSVDRMSGESTIDALRRQYGTTFTRRIHIPSRFL